MSQPVGRVVLVLVFQAIRGSGRIDFTNSTLHPYWLGANFSISDRSVVSKRNSFPAVPT